MAYWTLAVLGDDGAFHPQFGDYSRSIVMSEKRECWRGCTAQILRTETSDQRYIDKAIEELNREWKAR